jgi:Bacterial PH domain
LWMRSLASASDAAGTDTGVIAAVSAPNEPVRPVSDPGGAVSSAGKVTADGRRIYRLVPPTVIWWVWVGILVLSLGDLLIQGHSSVSPEFVFGLLTITGLVFAGTIWSRVVARDDGITVFNPFRRFDIPWGAIKGIFLADSVEVVCARDGQKKDKTVYSWALSSPRRARARSQLRGLQWDRGRRSRPGGYDQLPGKAKELAKMQPAELMARELAALSEQTRSGHASLSNGSGTATTAVISARWAWQPIAAVLVPGVALAVSAVLR